MAETFIGRACQVLVGTPGYGTGQLAPGDLLFGAESDGTAANPGHVGMYIALPARGKPARSMT